MKKAMKIKLFALSSLSLIVGLMWFGNYQKLSAGNADTESPRYDRQGILNEVNPSTYVFRVSSSGHVVNHTRVGELGSPTAKWLKLYIPNDAIQTSTGLMRHSEFWLDLPASDDDAILDAQTNVLTLTSLASAPTTYIRGQDLTQPNVPRNIVIFASVTAGGVSVTSTVLTATAFISGLDSLGRSTFTYQQVVTTAGATAGLGTIAFAQVSSITITVASTGTVTVLNNLVNFQIGTGDKIGLVNDLDSVGDIYHVSEAGVVTTTYTANAQYNTIDFATDGNGARDYAVRYIQKNLTPMP